MQELYAKMEPMYYAKDLQNLTKVKLQAVLICSIKSKQVLFHYSFSYVCLAWASGVEQIFVFRP